MENLPHSDDNERAADLEAWRKEREERRLAGLKSGAEFLRKQFDANPDARVDMQHYAWPLYQTASQIDPDNAMGLVPDDIWSFYRNKEAEAKAH